MSAVLHYHHLLQWGIIVELSSGSSGPTQLATDTKVLFLSAPASMVTLSPGQAVLFSAGFENAHQIIGNPVRLCTPSQDKVAARIVAVVPKGTLKH